MPDQPAQPDRAETERTDPGVVSDRILETVLGLVRDQMAEQARTTKRFMMLMLVILVVNAGLSGVNLAVQTMGVNVSTNGQTTTVKAAGTTTTTVNQPTGPEGGVAAPDDGPAPPASSGALTPTPGE